MRRVIALLFALALLLFPLPARAEACDEAAIFELYGPQGQLLTMVGRRIYEGDEYIAADNRLYRVERVDEGASAAYARLVGEEPPETLRGVSDGAWAQPSAWQIGLGLF